MQQDNSQKKNIPGGSSNDSTEELSPEATESNQLPTSEFGRSKPIAKALDISVITWFRWVKSGQAPPGIKLSRTVTVWRMSSVREMIQEKERQVA